MTEADWYKDAIVYELRVRSFYDSNGDGVGDLLGLTQKLDYLKDLGVSALWLLPLYPSPLKDDGYDIADYFSVHRAVGNLEDFRLLLREAQHRIRHQATRHDLGDVGALPTRAVQADRRDQVFREANAMPADAFERAPPKRTVGADHQH